MYCEDFFSEKTSEKLYNYFVNASWTWGFKSSNSLNKRSIPHWSIRFAGIKHTKDEYYDCENELDGIALEIWQLLKLKHFTDDILVRCYSNAITKGIDQRLHTDDKDPDSKTCIVYLNDYWNADWGGETIIWDREKRQITNSYLPKPRSILIIPGNCWHGVRPVSNYCDELRMTLMYKTKRKV